MSHIVSIKTQIRDPIALAAACVRLGLEQPTQGKARLFNAEAEGLIVQLPGWTYPAVKHVVPVAVTAAESVQTLRTWAAGRCLVASRPGIYSRGAEAATPTSRRVTRASAN